MAFIRKDKSKKPKQFPFTYLLLNIKLISNRRQGEDAYKQIFQDIYSNTITEHVGRGKRAFLRTMFPENIDGQEFYYGRITRFTDLENNSWVSVITREEITMNLEKGLYPNKQETEYVFVPQAHRLALKLSSDFTIKNAQDFFTKAIGKVVSSDEDFSVNIQQSTDIFEEIFKAQKVENLYINVTYTNSDEIGDDAAEWLDAQLKASNISEANLTFEAGKNETINLDTDLIKGGLDLARENGEVQARVKDVNGKFRRIITKEHPEKNKTVATSEDGLKNVIFMEVMQRYRNNDE
ncbi:DUF4747 family protein [Spirosoma oryzicola]|uniref:DUF4747 family protein n=1 Tax=Spirosoma oryzicola TaxID=2898794 RepID=UPI001E50BC36|nr:DUF4747 family protein [Spirosoma oryzicola]UHG93404.1 DUF4747 family protein [Spirosoma oryzicola]